MNAPLTSQQRLLAKIQEIRSQLSLVVTKAGAPQLAEYRPKWEHILEDLVEEAKKTPEVTIALVGENGAGKTTLINALLGAPLFPTKAGMPCTSAVCVIEHSEETRYRAEVTFVSRGEWQRELARLQGDIRATLDPGEDATGKDHSQTASIKKGAWQKLKAVFRAPDDAGPEYFLREGLKESQAVTRALTVGKEVFAADSPEQFQSQVKHFLTSDDPIWPVVEQVRVTGPFAVLRGGVKLVDLPGLNDPNQAREAVTLRYLKHCKFVWVVFPKRFNRQLVELMGAEDLFRQMLMDGRLDQLTFVRTHSDDVVADDAASEYGLPSDAPLETILDARRQTMRHTIAQALYEEFVWLASTPEDRERAAAVAGRLKRFHFFTVSARDCMAFRKLSRAKPLLDTLEQTEIPALCAHLERLGSDHGSDSHFRAVWRRLKALVLEVKKEVEAQRLRVSQQERLTAAQRKEVQEAAATAATFLDGRLRESQALYERDLSNCRSNLSDGFKLGEERGRNELNRTVEGWAQIHPHTLGALCRNGGTWRTAGRRFDLVGDLTRPLLNSIAFAWDEYFGQRLDGVMERGYGKLLGLGDEYTLKHLLPRMQGNLQLRQDTEKFGETTKKVLEEQLTQSRLDVRIQIDAKRASLHEQIPAGVKAAMKAAIAGAGEEFGTGMRHRIIDSHLRPSALRVAREAFKDARRDIESELNGLQQMMIRAYGEMAATVRRHAATTSKNVWGDALSDSSLKSFEGERKNLDVAEKILDDLRRSLSEGDGQ